MSDMFWTLHMAAYWCWLHNRKTTYGSQFLLTIIIMHETNVVAGSILFDVIQLESLQLVQANVITFDMDDKVCHMAPVSSVNRVTNRIETWLLLDHHNTFVPLKISVLMPLSDLYESTPVVEMGFGLQSLQPSLRAKSYANRASFTRATTIPNAACQSLYASAPPIRTSYTGQFIKDEMICASPGLGQQVCEVSQNLLSKSTNSSVARKSKRAMKRLIINIIL